MLTMVPDGMVPDDSVLPDTLPSATLNAEGRPVGALRDELRRIAGARNVLTLLGAWAQAAAVVAAAVWIDHPVAWAVAFVVMGRTFALLGILGHEAAHRLLFRNRRLNDSAGRWLCSYPAFSAQDAYRRVHMAHHRDEFGPDEPDLLLYAGYPIPRSSMRRKLLRDAFGVSGWKNLAALGRALRQKSSRPVVLRIVAAQVVLLAIATAFGRPELYFFMWFAPWMTVWRVLNRLRSIAEHGGMERSDDKRRTTHHVDQGWPARFWIVPYHTGWHLAHHVDPGVPWRNLPRLHRELELAGWVTPGITYPNYLALWRAMVRPG